MGPLGGFASAGLGIDKTGDVGFDLSYGRGPELGSPLGVSLTGTFDFLTTGGLRDASGSSVEMGGSAYSPSFIGGEYARTFDGTLLAFSKGGFDATGNQSQSAAVDVGIGMPGGSGHLFETFTITGGINYRTGEFFLCAGDCITANPFE